MIAPIPLEPISLDCVLAPVSDGFTLYLCCTYTATNSFVNIRTFDSINPLWLLQSHFLNTPLYFDVGLAPQFNEDPFCLYDAKMPLSRSLMSGRVAQQR